MAFFNLKNVPLETKWYVIKKECEPFGSVDSVRLNPDRNDASKLFGNIRFDVIEDKQGFLDYCKERGFTVWESEDRKKGTNAAPHTKQKNSSQKTQHKNNHNKTGHRQNTGQDNRKKTSIANPSFYFYKDDAYGRDITDFVLKQNHAKLFGIEGAEGFSLTTVYPGLLVGSGYTHPKLKSNDDDFQLGFFFDHTTGLPLISGSSIKGALRSVLENEVLAGALYEAQLVTLSLTPKQVVKTLFEEDGAVFYDAYIEKTDNEGKRIFGEDYITSHHSDETGGALKEPNPVRFLKVLPNVTFRFQFSFKKRENVQACLELFEAILLDFGVGAKTNVGYGQFQKV